MCIRAIELFETLSAPENGLAPQVTFEKATQPVQIW